MDQSYEQCVYICAAPTKKRSSKSRENVRGAKGTIRLTQVGIEEVKNIAQCSLVTSTGKVVMFKFIQEAPGKEREWISILLRIPLSIHFLQLKLSFHLCVCVCVSHSTSFLPLSTHFICIYRLSMATSKAMRKRISCSKLLMCCRRPSWRLRSPVLSCRTTCHQASTTIRIGPS